jgi:uncharacterized lipoprotein YddW (UPF0748 family)
VFFRYFRLVLVLAALCGAAGLEAQEEVIPPAAVSDSPPASLTTAITRKANLEGRVLWMDATANLERLSNRDSVSAILDKCKQANINTIVVDVKPLSGHVLYDSSVAPRLQEWKGFKYPAGYDLVLTAMLEARRRGIKIYVAINVFSEAHKLVQSGPLYKKPEQQATVYDVQRTVTAPDGATWTLAVGENVGPRDGEIASYDPRWRQGKTLSPEMAAVVVQDDTVSAVLDGALTEQGVLAVPKEGHLLVGRGSGAKWLLEHVRVGQSLKYTAREVLQPILESPSETVGAFVNPANPEARAYMLRVVEELANRYALDGIVFDRMRYASLRTDFSPLSRQLFEASLGKQLERFPQDIYEYDPVPGRPLIPGPYYKEWLEWRARTISEWLEEAKEVARRVRPGIGLGVYVGSWYPSYFGVGVNWASEDYVPGYEWMTPNYPATGYAGKLNWLTTGCYYSVPTREEARQLGSSEEATVEAAADTSVRAVNDAAFVYAGVQLLDYRGRPDDFRRALETALQRSQGVMIFDLVYLEEYNWWHILNGVFSVPRRAPHDVPGLQAAIQQTKKALQSPSTGP